MIKNKRAFEFSFAWIFAIIVGAVIIVLAIYSSSRFIQSEKFVQDSELGKEIGIILNPIETSLESGKISKISLPTETRIFNDCVLGSTFGSQLISVSSKSGIGEQWQTPGAPSSFHNKYLFSRSQTESKDFIVFSKPLEMPFKIADLIFLWPESNSYCFVLPPQTIESEISDFNLPSLEIANSASDCSSRSQKICFKNSKCDIDVSLDTSGKIKGSLKKNDFSNSRVYFENSALLYAAIFSDSSIYECQINRLMKRASELSWLYYSKSNYITPKGCSSNLETDLSRYAEQTFSLNSSLDLRTLSILSESIKERNDDLSCELF
jgi:hypothetical protein